MAEWFKAAVLKTASRLSGRGFESLPLRQCLAPRLPVRNSQEVDAPTLQNLVGHATLTVTLMYVDLVAKGTWQRRTGGHRQGTT